MGNARIPGTGSGVMAMRAGPTGVTGTGGDADA